MTFRLEFQVKSIHWRNNNMAYITANKFECSNQKIKKKADEFYLKLGKNEDILSYIGKHKTKQTICGFAMETENVIENAQNKFFKKNCDLLVVNDLFEDGAGFKTDTNKVALITKNFVDYLDLMSKEDLAHIILEKLMKVKGE